MLSTEGLIFMLLAWIIVGSLVVFAFSRVLRSRGVSKRRDRDERK